MDSFGFSLNYHIEVVVLSCENAIEFLVEDQDLNILLADKFQGPGNETKFVTIAGVPFVIEVDIIVKPFSMIAQVSDDIVYTVLLMLYQWNTTTNLHGSSLYVLC